MLSSTILLATTHGGILADVGESEVDNNVGHRKIECGADSLSDVELHGADLDSDLFNRLLGSGEDGGNKRRKKITRDRSKKILERGSDVERNGKLSDNSSGRHFILSIDSF